MKMIMTNDDSPLLEYATENSRWIQLKKTGKIKHRKDLVKDQKGDAWQFGGRRRAVGPSP